MLDTILDCYGSEKNEEMFEYAKELSKRFNIAMLTNFSDAFDELNKRLGLEEVFLPNKIFVSSKIKLKKPDHAAFEYVLDKISYKPNETIFVDDREDYLDGAIGSGLHGILFTDVNKLRFDINKILK